MNIIALEDTTVAFCKQGSPAGNVTYTTSYYQYSTDYTPGTEIFLKRGERISWSIRIDSKTQDASNYFYITSTGRIAATGKVSALDGGRLDTGQNYAYYGLFKDCTQLIDASGLDLFQVIGSRTYCFAYMFSGCTGLLYPPVIPLTELTNYCCDHMFYGCTSLLRAPDIFAKSVGSYACQYMFSGCTSIKEPPKIYTTSFGTNAFRYACENCTSIKLSETKTGDYAKSYSIPVFRNGAGSYMNYMFNGIGGPFSGTPTMNTIYYVQSGSGVFYGQNRIASINDNVKINCAGKLMTENITIKT